MSGNRLFLVTVPLFFICAGFFIAADSRAATPGDGWDTPEKAFQKIPRYNFSGPLGKSIRQLEKLGGVKIRADWEGIEATGVKRDTAVLLKGGGDKLIDVVELMLVRVMQPGRPLGWFIHGDTIYLTTQARVLRRTLIAPQPGRRRARQKQEQGQKQNHIHIKKDSAPRGRELRFEATDLSDVIETFRQITGLNFFVNWGALKTVGITRQTPISLRAKSISTAQAMNLVMDQLNADKDRLSSIYWVVDQGVIHISTGSALDTVMRTRTMDVSHLLAVTPNFISRRMKPAPIGSDRNSTNSGGSGSDSASIFGDEDKDKADTAREESLPELRARQEQQLIEIIQNSIGRDMWRPNGKGSITIFRKKLIISQSLLGWKLMETASRR